MCNVSLCGKSPTLRLNVDSGQTSASRSSHRSRGSFRDSLFLGASPSQRSTDRGQVMAASRYPHWLPEGVASGVRGGDTLGEHSERAAGLTVACTMSPQNRGRGQRIPDLRASKPDGHVGVSESRPGHVPSAFSWGFWDAIVQMAGGGKGERCAFQTTAALLALRASTLSCKIWTGSCGMHALRRAVGAVVACCDTSGELVGNFVRM